MKTAVSIPDPVFRAADKLAKSLGISRSELYAKALGDFLQEHDPKRVTEALNNVYANEDSEMDGVLLEMQAQAVGNDEW